MNMVFPVEWLLSRLVEHDLTPLDQLGWDIKHLLIDCRKRINEGRSRTMDSEIRSRR